MLNKIPELDAIICVLYLLKIFFFSVKFIRFVGKVPVFKSLQINKEQSMCQIVAYYFKFTCQNTTKVFIIDIIIIHFLFKKDTLHC